MDKRILNSIISFITLAILVIGVSIFLIYDEFIIGPAYIVIGLIGIIFLKNFKIKIKEVYPDIIFGIIDNGILVFAAALGGIYAGVVGAILGGAAGNTLSDGVGGFFEGKIAEKLRKEKKKTKRTSLSSMLGKMIGCLLGAGVALVLVWLIKIILNIF